MTTAWKQALTNALIKASVAKLQRICVSRATDGALCAISGRLTLSWEPSYLVEEDYCDLEPNVIYDIMNNGVGVIKAYTGINVSQLRHILEKDRSRQSLEKWSSCSTAGCLTR